MKQRHNESWMSLYVGNELKVHCTTFQNYMNILRKSKWSIGFWKSCHFDEHKIMNISDTIRTKIFIYSIWIKCKKESEEWKFLCSQWIVIKINLKQQVRAWRRLIIMFHGFVCELH